ncbi:MAG: MogA/MoaB family molybdenum cofactor biosynthesis protein [Methanomicrobiaceae archaeon]|nr:MogA/MoaB family molybdenum cofactor biosynthesis protein [Methanomicrobiaceae archaeon]
MDSSHIRDLEIKVAVVTVSTTRNRDTDISGKTILEMTAEKNLETVFYEIVPDDPDKIKNTFFKASGPANCIIFNGGTGLTHDDCTIEAIKPLFEKSIDGFGELFRMKSYEEIGTRSLLSRAAAGIFEGKAVFCIPGSTGAVKLAMKEIILPEIRHILTHASG